MDRGGTNKAKLRLGEWVSVAGLKDVGSSTGLHKDPRDAMSMLPVLYGYIKVYVL